MIMVIGVQLVFGGRCCWVGFFGEVVQGVVVVMVEWIDDLVVVFVELLFDEGIEIVGG